jgi:hypothetical protein
MHGDLKIKRILIIWYGGDSIIGCKIMNNNKHSVINQHGYIWNENQTIKICTGNKV